MIKTEKDKALLLDSRHFQTQYLWQLHNLNTFHGASHFDFYSLCFLNGSVRPEKHSCSSFGCITFFPNRIRRISNLGRTESATAVTCCLLFTCRGSERAHVLETDITSHHLMLREHTCRSVGDTSTRLNFELLLFHSVPAPLLPEAPLDGTAQLFVRHCWEQWYCASVFVACLCGSTAVFWGAFECLISLLRYPSFLVIFVFHSQLCLEKTTLWSVTRSIADKASLSGNFQPDQLCLSVVCLLIFRYKQLELNLIFNITTLNFAKTDRDTKRLKLNHLGATSGKISKAKLQVWSRSLHYFHRGWDTVPDLFPLSKFYPILLIIQPARYDPPGYISHLSAAPLSCSICHTEDKKEPCKQSEEKPEPPYHIC